MNDNPVITGVGLITALGSSAGETWNALLGGKSIHDHTRIPNITAPDRARAIAEIAAKEALIQSRWTLEQMSSPATALIVATSKGPIETWITPPLASPTVQPNISEIAARVAHNLALFHGPRLTISTACASGLHALIRAAMMIQSNEAQRALVIATESSLHPLFIGSFARLGILPPPGHGCRPFDLDRKGFLLAEAAAAICIETAAHQTSAAIVEIHRYGLGGDATHLTGNDPQSKTLKHLLSRVIQNEPVDFIHAHGTATLLNDPAELTAIESELPSQQSPMPMYSHKAALGHTLGASGLVSIVLNCLAHQCGMIPGNIHTSNPLPADKTVIDARPREMRVKSSVAIAAGFGGPTAVVSLKSS